MAKRVRLEQKSNNYFTSEKDYSFVSSGCALLDCALGGGWVLGRMANIVGDKSTAKTALATEALTNFVLQYPDGAAAYRETEAAFDRKYSAAMGVPIDRIDFGPEGLLNTVEELNRDLEQFLDKQIKADAPGIYVLDSLDALSDDVEMAADIGKGTYGTAKAKLLSTMFRKLTRKVESSKVLLLIVSQVRENINPQSYGEKFKRAGGKSMDFYASHILWLAHIKMLKKTIHKVERPYGVTIRAKCKKNKVSVPFREAEFNFIFGYGVDDVTASVEWLKEVKRLDVIDLTEKEVKEYLAELDSMSDKDYSKERQMLARVTKKLWNEIEVTFLPTRRKYAA